MLSFSIQTVDLKGNIQTFSFPNSSGNFLILYFYPRDLTSGCTQEARDFAAKYPDFQNANTQILGVSRDSLKRHQKFIETENLPFPLGADEEENLCQLFGVMKNKTLYGKPVRGIERSTFLFSPSGVLLKEWRKVKVPGHAEEVWQTLLNVQKK